MRRLLDIVLVPLLLLGCALASEQQTNAKTLVIDVYSIKASGVVQREGLCPLGARSQRGKGLFQFHVEHSY
jgi:hypothetical protein